MIAHDLIASLAEAMEASPIEIGDARHEGETEIAGPAAIDMMTDNVDTGICFEERVEHMNCFARPGGDDLGTEGGITAGDCGVELDDEVGAVASVDAAGDFTAAAEIDILRVDGETVCDPSAAENGAAAAEAEERYYAMLDESAIAA